MNVLTKNAPKRSPKCLSLFYFVGPKQSRKIPAKFRREKLRKFTDELLQERREDKLGLNRWGSKRISEQEDHFVRLVCLKFVVWKSCSFTPFRRQVNPSIQSNHVRAVPKSSSSLRASQSVAK